MTLPRSQQISLDSTCYYHCVSRCVRRAFLCGFDELTQTDFSHRKQWVEEKLFLLSDIFTIDICAYAVMSNHYHVVLHVDSQRATELTAKEVANRWHTLFSATDLSERFCNGKKLTPTELETFNSDVARWRKILTDISWFMRCMNESIARSSNIEDKCTGRFWEGRFKSQALLDEKSLLACMAYVDLNPIRSGAAKTLGEADFTSIQVRKNALETENSVVKQRIAKKLMPFKLSEDLAKPALPFALTDYIELVEWSGRIVLDDKGSINETMPKLSQKNNFSFDDWKEVISGFESLFKSLVGCADIYKQVCKKLNFKRCSTMSIIRRFDEVTLFRTHVVYNI